MSLISPQLWSNYSANKYVEDAEIRADANVRWCSGCANGSQDENTKSVPTHHGRVYMGKKKAGPYPNKACVPIAQP